MHSKKVIEESIYYKAMFSIWERVPEGHFHNIYSFFPRIYSQIIKKKWAFTFLGSTTCDGFLKRACYHRYSLANTTVVCISTLLYFISAVPHLSLIALHKLELKEVILAFSWVFDNEEMIQLSGSIKIKVRTDTLGIKIDRFIFWL